MKIKTVDKLILKSFLGPMVASFFIVLFVLMMNFLWKYIDEMVGKGLGLGTIIEIMFYGTSFLIAMGFPLATLFAAIMTMGNLGENYELLALKSAGVSLPRIMFSLFVVTLGMATASFFVANNLVPYSDRKVRALMNDVREQKQKIEFKDGQFFNGVDKMSIRVEHQDPVTGLLNGLMIYDTSLNNGEVGQMSVTVADSGYIRLTDDKRFLEVMLFGGEYYVFTRGRNWYESNSLKDTSFDSQHSLQLTPGYDFNRSDASIYGNRATAKNVAQLKVDIDSLNREVNSATTSTYRALLYDRVFSRDTMVVTSTREAKRSLSERTKVNLMDSIALLDNVQKDRLYSSAQAAAAGSRSDINWDEMTAKDTISQLYTAQIEWHKKWALPVAVLVFFLIGASLGAIIRKGGLGMPIIISVAFFVIYYVIYIIGDKLAKEGTWPAFWGGWIPTLVLMPIAIYLTYKATNDSGLLNTEWYIIQYQKLKKRYGKAKNIEHH
jgi:lipopolysaccharide export system permease protein